MNCLEQYLKINNPNEEVEGYSLLYHAAYRNNLKFVQKLISYGADVNYKNRSNNTVLAMSAYYGFTDIVVELINNGARIDSICMDRAYRGWDGNVQIAILEQFVNRGWINIYLDDLRDIPEGFVGARTVEEAIDLILNNRVHMLSLDHDLGMDKDGNLLPTGYDLVKYICANGLRADKIYLHTSNVVGRKAMYDTLIAAQARGFIDRDIKIHYYSITVNRYSDK